MKQNRFLKVIIWTTAVLVFLTLWTVFKVKFHTSGSTSLVNDIPHREPKSDLLTLAYFNGSEDMDSKTKDVLFEMMQRGKPLLVTFLNDGFLPMAHSWLCNTMFMGIHDQILLFATDLKSKDELDKFWPQVSVINVAEESLSGNQRYEHAGYLRIMVKRTRWIQWMLNNSVEFLLFEFDFFWFSNPLPAVQNKSVNHDIVVIHDNDGKSYMACGCFIYMKPTQKTLCLWNELTRLMNDIEKKIKGLPNNHVVKFHKNDQTHLSELLAERYCGVGVEFMPKSQFPYGTWFHMNETRRKTYKPLILHNNYIIGNNRKILRAMSYNLWFWNSTSNTCDTNLVKKYTGRNFTAEMIANLRTTPPART